MKKLIIDRFEGDFAVCEQDDKSFINVLKTELPTNVKAGDCLIWNGELYTIDSESTERKKKIIEEKFRKLMK